MGALLSSNDFYFLNGNERERGDCKLIKRKYSELLGNTKGSSNVSGHELKENKSVCLNFTLVTFSCLCDSWSKGRDRDEPGFTK